MDFSEIVRTIADILKDFDNEKPIHRDYQPGIGPFGEPQIVKVLAERLTYRGIPSITKRTPDLDLNSDITLPFFPRL